MPKRRSRALEMAERSVYMGSLPTVLPPRCTTSASGCLAATLLAARALKLRATPARGAATGSLPRYIHIHCNQSLWQWQRAADCHRLRPRPRSEVDRPAQRPLQPSHRVLAIIAVIFPIAVIRRL